VTAGDRDKAPFEHWCEHEGCRAWGGFGAGVSLLKGERGRWYCARHRPALVAARPQPPAPAAGTRQTMRQGTLL